MAIAMEHRRENSPPRTPFHIDSAGPESPDRSLVIDASADRLRALDGLRRRRLFGLDFVDAPDLRPVLDALLSGSASGDRAALPVLVTPNVDIVVQLHQRVGSVETDVFRRAHYILPDGMPIVAASRLLRSPLSARLTGSGLFEALWPALATQRRPVLVVCASTAIARRLRLEAPTAQFVTPPLFDESDDEAIDEVVTAMLAAADTARPDFVLLGLGHPKDALLSARLLDRWASPLGAPPLCCCLGGSFAMYTGFKRRAPRWMQQAGLEWFYRFRQEPRRLFRRYFVRDTAFFGIVVRAYRSGQADNLDLGQRG